ncbi:MAG: FeoB-associated Cys-rich membrane protein [Desulfovibrionaceae bacterium]
MFDSILVVAIVAAACVYLARRYFRSKSVADGCGCGGCSGCHGGDSHGKHRSCGGC